MSILEAAKRTEDKIIAWRRQVHANPELGLDTPETEALVAGELRSMGLEVTTGLAEHGVVGLLRGGGRKARTFAIRADMDALPVTEDTGLPFASKIPGRMHACGHDSHVAMLLGAAQILSGMKDEVPGNVKFIFQPGEEGAGGARIMIEQGVLESPKVDAIIGGHVGTLWDVTAGQIGIKAGPLMAASDHFTIIVRGKGGHGAAPHLSVDPIVIASHIVIALQTILSRDIKPVSPAVVTVGAIKAGTAFNIIPNECAVHGTVRYLDEESAALIPLRMREIAEGIAKAMKGSASVDYRRGYPPTVNDPAMTDLVKDVASKIVGEKNVVIVDPTMGAEDMSYFLQRVPGAYFCIGTGNPKKGTDYPNHHPKFDVDEDVLHLGSALFAQAAIDYLSAT